jgi:hydroxymethylbilane synthase
MTLRLATRRSPLALTQARTVAALLSECGIDVEIVEVVTDGDRRTDVPLRSLGGQGIFAVEVQRAVMDGRADVAVHSAKDLPSVTPDELVLASAPERRDAADVLVGRSLAGLGPGGTVATGSPRRRALLSQRRPDLNFVELRGNMAARLSAVDGPGIDSVIAAAAALERLGLTEKIAERLDPEWFVPQVGQGTLALEVRVNDHETLEAVSLINDANVMRTLVCERAFLAELGAGCSIPAGAYAYLDRDELVLSAVMADDDGIRVLRHVDRDTQPSELGQRVARHLRDVMGGGSLNSVR